MPDAVLNQLIGKLLNQTDEDLEKWSYSESGKSCNIGLLKFLKVEEGDSLEQSLGTGYHLLLRRDVLISVALNNNAASTLFNKIQNAQEQKDTDKLSRLRLQAIKELEARGI